MFYLENWIRIVCIAYIAYWKDPLILLPLGKIFSLSSLVHTKFSCGCSEYLLLAAGACMKPPAD